MTAQDWLNLLYTALAIAAGTAGFFALAVWAWWPAIRSVGTKDPLDRIVPVQTLNFLDGSKVEIKNCQPILQAKWSPAPRRHAIQEAGLPVIAEKHAQIIYTLQRAERSLRHQANMLGEQMDYSAEFFSEDADRMNEAIELVMQIATATPGPSRAPAHLSASYRENHK